MLENPILTKELRTRMRGTRAFWILFAYVGILAISLFSSYASWWESQARYNMYGFGNPNNMGGMAAATIGRTFYGILFTVQAVLVGLITPSLTAGGVSIEKEQRTYDMLTTTLLPRRAIITGKLFSAVAFLALLLTSSLPLVSLCFVLGGVSPGEVASAYVLLLVCAFLYGAVGIACSSVARATSTATVTAFGVIGFLFLVTLPLSMLTSYGTFGSMNNSLGPRLSALNPIGAVTAGTLRESYFGLVLPAWVAGLVLNGLLGVIFLQAASNQIEGRQNDRSGRLRALVALYVGLLAAGVIAGFLPVGGAGHNMMWQSPTLYVLGPAAFLTLFAPLLWTPIFATGNGLPADGLRSLWDPRRLRRGEAPSGVLFTLLLAGLCAAILCAAVTFTSANLANGQLRLVAARDLSLILFALTAAFGGLGLLLSAVLRNRWAASGATLGVMLFLYLIPMATVLSNDAGIRRASVLDNALYLSPLPAAIEMTEVSGPREVWSSLLQGHTEHLAFGRIPFRYVTPALYAVLGLGTYLALFIRGTSRRRALPPSHPATN